MLPKPTATMIGALEIPTPGMRTTSSRPPVAPTAKSAVRSFAAAAFVSDVPSTENFASELVATTTASTDMVSGLSLLQVRVGIFGVPCSLMGTSPVRRAVEHTLLVAWTYG